MPLPRRQVMGVPADLDDLARCGLLSAEGMARAREDLGLPATQRGGDVDVASYVGARFGPEVVDRLVDPLLGRGLRGPVGGPVVRGDPARPGGGVPPARVPRRGGGCADAAARAGAGRRRRRGGGHHLHHAHRRPGHPAGGRRRRLGGGGADRRDGPRAGAHPGWLAADRGIRPRAGMPGRRRRRAGRAGPARGPAPRRAAGRRRRAGGAGRDRLREHGHRHPGLPGLVLPAAAGGQRLPGAGRGRSPGEGGHLLLGQVAAPAFGRSGHGRGPLLAGAGGGGAAAAAGRRRPGRAWPRPTWPRRPGSAASPPTSG